MFVMARRHQQLNIAVQLSHRAAQLMATHRLNSTGALLTFMFKGHCCLKVGLEAKVARVWAV